jgi:hypothetical protein
MQGFVVAAATPLASTEALAPKPEPVVVANDPVPEPRPVTVAASGRRVANGFFRLVPEPVAQRLLAIRRRVAGGPATIAAPGAAFLRLPAPVPESMPPAPKTVTIRRPGLTVHEHSESRFRLEVDRRRRVVLVTVGDRPDVAFEIDYKDRAADTHKIGVTPVLLGHRLEGQFLKKRGERTFPLVTPTRDAGKITYTTITNEGDRLQVRFDGGPYANLREGGEGETYLDVVIEVSELKVRMDLEGLYYVRPAVGAELSIDSAAGVTSIAVTEDRPSFLTYIDDATEVVISDSSYGDYRMSTDVSRLQVQWNGVGTAFELDFDHAYKDLGQENVQSRLVFRVAAGD